MNLSKQSVLLRYLLLLIILISGCKSKEIYDHHIPLKGYDWVNNKQLDNCNNVLSADYVLQLSHESLPERELSKYTLLILFDSVVYNGKFRQQIKLKNVPICLNSGANMINPVFVIIDSIKNQVYVWQNEKSYPLDKYFKMNVKLRSKQRFNIDDGAFHIKLHKHNVHLKE